MRNSLIHKILPTLLLAAGFCFTLQSSAMACGGPAGGELALILSVLGVVGLVVISAAIWVLYKVIQGIVYLFQRNSEPMV